MLDLRDERSDVTHHQREDAARDINARVIGTTIGYDVTLKRICEEE